jgi:DNA invertase Pin-like site-specific DNA recombinase
MKTAGRRNSDNSALAFSYVRFSTPEQRKGDSLRRQTEDAQAWCERNGARLDASTTLHDLGTSAYRGDHRKNPDRNALAAFLKLVEDGRIPRGSFLVIESLDRLTREHIRPALTLLLNLIDAGVRIVQLKPVEMIYDEAVEPMQLMMALMELARGNSESRVKSQRVGAAWEARRTHVRNGHKLLTSRVPAWVTVEGVRAESFTLAVVPERAAVIRKIFALAAAGLGARRIVGKLSGVPAFGGQSARWNPVYVAMILKDRRVLGECQPRRGGKPDGEAIKDYFPRVVSDADFDRAAGALRQRTVPGRGKGGPGRQGKHADPFAGLVRDARDGGIYRATTTVVKGYRYRVLRTSNSLEGRGGGGRTFQLPVFEAAVLSRLREIDPHEILNGDHGPDETLALGAELAEVESSIASIVAEMDENGDSPALFRRLRQKEARQAELVRLLADAREKAAHPLSESWGQTQSLIDALNNAPDQVDARLRLRPALRRIVDTIYLLVVPRGRVRLAAVQVWFAGGKRHRDYLIHFRAAGYCDKGGWSAHSLADVVRADDIDLRQAADAATLAGALRVLDLPALERHLAALERPE